MEEDVVLEAIATIVRAERRINANNLAARYKASYGTNLDFRTLGYRKLGRLLDRGDERLWRLDRMPARYDSAGKRVESGALFLRALEDEEEEGAETDDEAVDLVGFYHYTRPRWSDTALEATTAWMEAWARGHGLKGRIRLAHEGVNATLSGPSADVAAAVAALIASDVLWSTVDFKVEACGRIGAWRSLQVWTAPEICGLGCDAATQLALDEIGPGVRLPPDVFHAAIGADGADSVLVDVRNRYETSIGTFHPPPGSRCRTLDPSTRTFADFRPWLDANHHILRGKDVFMFCTGGVRCERASALVKARLGSDRVFHLEGGVVRYMEQFDESESLFKGKNYVFDRRPAHFGHPAATADVLGRCAVCATPWDAYRGRRRCVLCHTLLLVCDTCLDAAKDDQATLVCDCCKADLSQ